MNPLELILCAKSTAEVFSTFESSLCCADETKCFPTLFFKYGFCHRNRYFESDQIVIPVLGIQVIWIVNIFAVVKIYALFNGSVAFLCKIAGAICH